MEYNNHLQIDPQMQQTASGGLQHQRQSAQVGISMHPPTTVPTRSHPTYPPDQLLAPTGKSTSTSRRRVRTVYNNEAVTFLEHRFLVDPYPDYESRVLYAKTLGVQEDRIQVWFQNKRSRYTDKKLSKTKHPNKVVRDERSISSNQSSTAPLPNNSSSNQPVTGNCPTSQSGSLHKRRCLDAETELARKRSRGNESEESWHRTITTASGKSNENGVNTLPSITLPPISQVLSSSSSGQTNQAHVSSQPRSFNAHYPFNPACPFNPPCPANPSYPFNPPHPFNTLHVSKQTHPPNHLIPLTAANWNAGQSSYHSLLTAPDDVFYSSPSKHQQEKERNIRRPDLPDPQRPDHSEAQPNVFQFPADGVSERPVYPSARRSSASLRLSSLELQLCSPTLFNQFSPMLHPCMPFSPMYVPTSTFSYDVPK